MKKMRNNTKNIRKGVTAILFALIMIASVSVVATASELPILDFDLRQGSGTTIIDSANGIVGTTHGTVWSTDPSGQPVLYFDSPIKWRWQFGAGDHVEIPYHDALNSPHISIEVWVYPMLAGYYTVFAERIRDREEWRAMTSLGFVSTGYHTGTQPYFGLSFGGVQTNVISPTDITLNEWHHIVGTYDGNDMKLYVDGKLVATEFGVGGPRDAGSNPFYIGHAPTSNHYFNGYYAQFKMYDRALTTEEVAYNFGSPVEAPVANAGLDQTVEQTYYPGADVTLDGSGSNDPDGDPLTYSWTWDDGSATGVNPTVSLPLGTTTITLIVNDGTVDSDSDTVVITVQDTTPPVITCPPDETVEQATAAGTVVPLTATATDICDAEVEITSDAPAIFPLGTTTVTFTATDNTGNIATDTVVVTVEDTTAPVLTCPEDVTVEQETAAGTEVTLEVTAEDICDADVEITSDAPAIFPLGTTTVTFTAIDNTGNIATDTVVVTVEDTTAPVLTCPEDVTVEQETAAGTEVTLEVTAEDICDADVEITSDAPAIFPLGTTTVTFTATDNTGNIATDTVVVTVEDTTAPVLTCPEDVTVEQETAAGTEVTLTATVSDICDANPTVTWSHGPTAVFPLGATTVTVTATDASGNSQSDTVVVTVIDTTLPEISVAVSPDTLWPANHKMVDITATVTATDICDADPTVVLTSVTSNEPDDAKGNGDGKTVDDIQGADVGTEDYSFQLRAERAGGGDGRIYTITYMVTDASGNSASASATVVVSHDMD